MSSEINRSDVLDGMDELTTARALVELIAMTARHMHDDDDRAISAGCDAALARIDRALDLFGGAGNPGQVERAR